MQRKPAYRSTSVPVEGSPVLGTYWYVNLGDRVEAVYVYDFEGREVDLDVALQGAAEHFEGELSGLRDTSLGGAPGRTAAITGKFGGRDAEGFAAISRVGSQVLMVAMLEWNAQRDELYPQFLELAASVKPA